MRLERWLEQRRIRPRGIQLARRGAAVVEFAVVAPVFIILVFGMIECGRMVMVQQVLTNASREGARCAVIVGKTAADASDVVDDYLADANINGSTTTFTPSTLSSAAPGDTVTCNVTVPFSNVSWLPSPFWFKSANLTGTTVMRREGIE